MAAIYRCDSSGRRQRLLEQTAAPGARINAIEYLLVTDDDSVPDDLRQRLLQVRFLFADHVSAVTLPQLRVRGGVRIKDPQITWIHAPTSAVPIGAPLSPEARLYLNVLRSGLGDQDHWLWVLVDKVGDFSRYDLLLRTSGNTPPPGFDLRQSEVSFSFMVKCASPFDCKPAETPRPPGEADPPLDYLARDFESFRRLMFDRMALIQPRETSRDPVTLRGTLVDLMAHAADQLSYFQDAVATEAYLETARRRSSVRRHARLVDYEMHEGVNARTFVQLQIAEGQRLVGAAAGPPLLGVGTTFFTRVPGLPVVLPTDQQSEARAGGALAFQALTALNRLSGANNAIAFHTWGDTDCCLPAGATAATVADPSGDLALAPGDFVILEQLRGPVTALEADADPALRHVVCLTSVEGPILDPVVGVSLLELTWHEDDALPSPLPLSAEGVELAVVRGNLVLVDHGDGVDETVELESYGNQGRVRARVARPGLTWSEPYRAFDEDQHGELVHRSARRMLEQDPRQAVPAVRLEGELETWTARRDLLGSVAAARDFVVETETDGSAWLRFGDDTFARRPALSTGFGQVTHFAAHYRVGNGPTGNIGADALAHLVADPRFVTTALSAAITHLSNPVPASGGRAPESLEEVRLYAPQAFRVQKRAVTESDWAEVAGAHREVQRAVATIRWTGSWNTVFLSIDRIGGLDVDDEFKARLFEYLAPFRLAGYDLELGAPRPVPLDIALTVCVQEGFFRDVVEQQLLAEFGTALLPDGTRGFFHPDNFTFGQPVYLSQIVARASRVRGVGWVDVTRPSIAGDHDNRFKRWGEPQRQEIDDGRILIGRLEIARCDNDRSRPDNGQIRFFMEGGS